MSKKDPGTEEKETPKVTTTNAQSSVIDMSCKPPAGVAEILAKTVGVTKCAESWFNLVILGILAGVYIGFGAALATYVGHDAAGYVGFGLAKFMAGAVFCIGLVLVIVAGAELFTGNNLILASVLGGHTKFTKLLRNWAIVYVANFVGSVLLAALVYASGIWKSNDMAVGIGALNIANAKVNLSFGAALTRGILCNWLVCLAVWMTLSSRDVTGKILAIFFPIMGFVAMGFEHSIANMYFIPMGLFLKSSEVLTRVTADVSNLTWGGGLIVKNLIPVTIGNIIGGSGFVALLYWSVYRRKASKQ